MHDSELWKVLSSSSSHKEDEGDFDLIQQLTRQYLYIVRLFFFSSISFIDSIFCLMLDCYNKYV